MEKTTPTNVMNVRQDDETNAFSVALSEHEFVSEPLSLFEEYMLRDDSPQYPMEPIFHLSFRGRLDRTIARQAFWDVLTRHPLMRSHVVKKGGRFFWVPSETAPEVDYVDYDATPDVFNGSGFPRVRPLNLWEEPGFRVLHIESKRENWSRLVLQFHHSVADGIGLLRTLEEWLILYSRRIGTLGSDVKLPKLTLEAWRDRLRIGWRLGSYLRNYFHTWRTTRQYLFRFPRPLVHVGAFGKVKPEVDSPFMTSTKLSRDETTAYLARAKSLGATVNDALLADCFRAQDKWLSDVMHDEKNGRLRVMAPINMRSLNGCDASLANVVSTVFVDRTRRESRQSHDSLIKNVASEMQWVKKRDQRYVFLLVLRVLRYVPGAFKAVLRAPVSRASCVLSNLGRVLEKTPILRDAQGRAVVGDATLEQVEVEAPIRHKTALSVVGFTYAGELNLCVHYDSRLITNEQAQAFAQIFRKELLA